jgi:xanthine dehydrogenase accessory factor
MTWLSLGKAVALALDAQRHGRGAVVVTVVSGETESARPGDRMVVYEGGSSSGGIDRRLDPLLVDQALQTLAERRSRSRSYDAHGPEATDVGVEGGQIDVYFEVLALPPKLIIVGAGHIAAPLATIGKLLDFEVSVLDDRSEYANRGRFPTVDHILVGPYRETVASLAVDRDTYIVLVTRGHVHDLACLEEVIDSPAAYIGMIGSKRRVRTVVKRARENGVDEENLRRLHAPIGLDIGAQTPSEIATAIAAEIVSVRRGHRALSLSLVGSARG